MSWKTRVIGFVVVVCVLGGVVWCAMRPPYTVRLANKINLMISNNDFEGVKAIVEENPEVVDYHDEDGFSPLHVAAAQENEKTVMFLLNNGADVNTSGPYGVTALDKASETGHLIIVKLLLDMGATMEGGSSDRDSALHSAALYGHKDIVKLLLDRGIDVNVRGWRCDTPLHLAASRGHTEVVKLLIARGADVNAAAYREGLTPLLEAAFQGSTDTVEVLVNAGADLNATDHVGRTPEDRAAINNHSETVELLRKHSVVE